MNPTKRKKLHNLKLFNQKKLAKETTILVKEEVKEEKKELIVDLPKLEEQMSVLTSVETVNNTFNETKKDKKKKHALQDS